MILSRQSAPAINGLVAFEAAARHGSFTRAAEELNLTQGAVSRQIRGLEDSLGVHLFERIRRQVLLTELGRIYLIEVQNALGTLAQAGDKVRLFGAEQVLSLAVLPTMATRWLIPRLPRFLARQPGVTLNLLVRLEAFSFEQDPFDAAIHFGDPVWPGATLSFLCREQIVAVASPRLVAQGVNSPQALLQATLLHQTTRPRAWEEWFAHQGLSAAAPVRGPRFEQFGMLAEAAAAGIGVALIPRFLIEAELRDGRLAAVDARVQESRKAYWLVVPDFRQRHPLVTAFGAWLCAEAGTIGTGDRS